MTWGMVETLQGSDWTAYTTPTNGAVRTFTYTPNDLSDLVPGIAGQKPYEIDEWSAFYKRYRVKGYKVTCYMSNAANGAVGIENFNNMYIIGHQSNSTLPVCNPIDTAPLGQEPNGDLTWDREKTLLSNRKLHSKMQSQVPAYNGNLQPRRLTQRASVDAILYQERVDVDDRIGEMTKATGSPPVSAVTSPVTSMFHHVSVRAPFATTGALGGTANDIVLNHRIELDVELFDKRTTA